MKIETAQHVLQSFSISELVINTLHGSLRINPDINSKSIN